MIFISLDSQEETGGMGAQTIASGRIMGAELWVGPIMGAELWVQIMGRSDYGCRIMGPIAGDPVARGPRCVIIYCRNCYSRPSA